MPIVSPPLYNPSALSYPVEFITSATSANTVLYANAALYVDAVLITTVQKTPFQVIGNTYYFKIDLKRVVQETIAPLTTTKTSCFGDLDINYAVENDDLFAHVGIIVTYSYEDPVTGKPVDLGIVDSTPLNVYEVINAQRQIGQSLDLDDYVFSPQQFLTNQPEPYDITTNENLFLSFVGVPLLDAIELKTYDSSGATIDTGVFAVPNSAQNKPVTIGAGVQQLNGLTFLSGSVNMLNPNVASYSVQTGRYIGAVFVAFGLIKNFSIVNDCSKRSLRVHFLNRLGGADAFTFTASKVRKESSTSSLGKKPLNFDYTATPPLNTYDRGAFKIDVKAGEFYELESSFYGEAKGEWLAELLTSPETYIETPQGLVACTIDDSTITISDIDNLLTVKAIVRLAVDKFIQRY